MKVHDPFGPCANLDRWDPQGRRHERFRLWIAALGKTGFNFKTLACLGDAANALQLSALWQGHRLAFGANLSLDITTCKPADGVFHKQKLTCQELDCRIRWPWSSSSVSPSLWDVGWANRQLKPPSRRVWAYPSNPLFLLLQDRKRNRLFAGKLRT